MEIVITLCGYEILHNGRVIVTDIVSGRDKQKRAKAEQTVARIEAMGIDNFIATLPSNEPEPTQLDRIELNQAELIVSQEYTACLLELQML